MININEYKLIADFNLWCQENDPDKLYCITTEEGEELFDAYEDDFIDMVDKGIVNGEGNYYLLNNPSEEEIKQYAKKYGIHWSDKDTSKHEIAHHCLYNAITALIDAVKGSIAKMGYNKVVIQTLSFEYGKDVEETWVVENTSEGLTFTNKENNTYSIEDLTISTLIDIDNAILCDNVFISRDKC